MSLFQQDPCPIFSWTLQVALHDAAVDLLGEVGGFDEVLSQHAGRRA